MGLVSEAAAPLVDAQTLAERPVGVVRIENAYRNPVHSFCENLRDRTADTLVIGERSIVEIRKF